MTSPFLDCDLYPKFLLRFPGEMTISAFQGIKSVPTSSRSLQEQAIVTAPFDNSWKEFISIPSCWIPQESITLSSYEELHPPSSLDLQILTQEEIPDSTTWTSLIEKIKRGITSSLTEKVVASRESIFTINACSPSEILAFLFSKTANAKNRAAIALMPCPNHLFFSMSPEKLFSAQGETLTCDLVAGTFSSLRAPLTLKEQAENDFVLLDLQEQLLKLKYKAMDITKMETIPSGNLFHLRRKLKASFFETPDYLKLASHLHPTAAICGYPRKASLQVLERDFSRRGFFAGYMGLISKDAAELFVAIRSALIEKAKITLFAGAGIILESDPKKEWDELNLKIDPYMEMFFANSTADQFPR